ncbi:MAG: hypothetical protein IH618_08170 [Ignavibacteriaceae bacterium]|nr:hypothetical protein [Ignavibacteriaceae bacterium]
MKTSRYIICLICTMIMLSDSVQSQERDSLIQLYPGMGDTLDLFDREIFNLYQDVDEYKYAQLFSRDGEFLVSKITYLDDGILRDTLTIEDYHQLYFLRQNVSKIIMENDKKLNSPLDASVFTNTGAQYDGRFEMFSKKYLYLNSDFNYLTGNSSGLDFKTSFSHVDSIQIAIEPNVGPYVGYGALGGFALGFIAGIATFNDDWALQKETKWTIFGAFGAVTGFLLGWLIGESVPPDLVNIRFNTPNDVVKLKDYSAYYFQYNKTLEEGYLELK